MLKSQNIFINIIGQKKPHNLNDLDLDLEFRFFRHIFANCG